MIFLQNFSIGFLKPLLGSFPRFLSTFLVFIIGMAGGGSVLNTCGNVHGAPKNLDRADKAFHVPVHIQIAKVTWESNIHAVVHVHFQLPPGYKFYAPAQDGDDLRNTPELSFQGSDNVDSIQPRWPASKLWAEYDQKAHVYTGSFDVPVDVYLTQRHKGALALTIKGMLCSQVCQPFQMTLNTPLEPESVSVMDWWFFMAAAFLGGLILNLMPCVLPVLGLKLRTFTNKGAYSIQQVCTWTLWGIFGGFWLFAGVVIVAKSMFGLRITWGAQLQNPYFIIVMIWVMLASAYSLWGVFHAHTPSWVLSMNNSLAQKKQGPWKVASSGLLAVLMGTPCSAPILGPAVTFALTGSPWEIFLFFNAIACGFGLPYIFGLFMKKQPKLPKPGPWMVVVERCMGVLFFLSAVWLVMDPLSSFLLPIFRQVSVLFLILWFFIPIFKNVGFFKKHQKISFATFFLIPSIMGFALLPLSWMSKEVKSVISMKDDGISWIAFNEDLLQKTMNSGRIVFVDMTGTGCMLCKVNKWVFADAAVQRAMTSPSVVCMRGDFSRGDPVMLSFLQRFGRSAIPFNLIISKAHPKGMVLSEMLTKKEILDGLAAMRSFQQKDKQGGK